MFNWRRFIDPEIVKILRELPVRMCELQASFNFIITKSTRV